MAKTKGSKGGKAVSWKGIPKHEHERIRKIMGYGIKGYEGKTPLYIWRSLKRHWKQQAEDELAKKRAEAERQQKITHDHRNRTIKTVREGIRKLAIIRDELDAVERGRLSGDVVDRAMFLRAALVEAGREMEEALFLLGIVEGAGKAIPRSQRGKFEGWFIEVLNPKERIAA